MLYCFLLKEINEKNNYGDHKETLTKAGSYTCGNITKLLCPMLVT
jgi:hypothetical protein